MEYIVIIVTCIIILICLKFVWDIKIKDIKKMKELGYNKNLNIITNKLPENTKICKNILKKLNNEKVKIEENNNSKTSFYFVLSDTILIANIKNTFTRVQTIAHECLHSIQNRKTLLFNFIFSNIYFGYFIIICILGILKINKNFENLNLFILIMFSFIYYAIRSYLEMDAMIKAKYLAEEYMQEENTLNNKEQKEILKYYEEINNIGIKLTNYILMTKSILKVLIYSTILLIF